MMAKRKQDLATKLAATILPEEQVKPRLFAVSDVSNHSDEDQRYMLRSGQKKTIRRLTAIGRLVALRTISRREGAICQWYADQHEQGFEVSNGCTANYLGTGGGGFGMDDLLARHNNQAIARQNYDQARKAIDPRLIGLFERVVLGKLGLGEAGGKERYSRLSRSFRLAVDQLDRAVGHLVSFDR
jgi:hypothetical protein